MLDILLCFEAVNPYGGGCGRRKAEVWWMLVPERDEYNSVG
jgi:hypothetical protein